eukprot:674912-Amorphochlora_amoeboformis.AAC.1
MYTSSGINSVQVRHRCVLLVDNCVNTYSNLNATLGSGALIIPGDKVEVMGGLIHKPDTSCASAAMP